MLFRSVPEPGEKGGDTWKGDSSKHGGGAAWFIGSYDPKLNLVYYGTSNPAPWAAVVRGKQRASNVKLAMVVPGSGLVKEQAEREGGVVGGATRSASVRCGLSAVPADATIICVHDAARPFASEFLFDEVIDAVCSGADGAVPGIPVVDTIKVVDESNVVTSTPDRRKLVAVQTPQAFRAKKLRQAHENKPEGTDDSTLVEAHGGRIVVINGDPLNRKITTPEDLNWARAISRGEV